MIRLTFSIALLSVLFQTAVSIFPNCTGSATYNVTFQNFLTTSDFGDLIPPTGLVFSPLAGASHSNRQSFFTIRGFASPEVEQIAENGVNELFVTRAKMLSMMGGGVKTVASVEGLTLPGHASVLTFDVDCEHPFITVLGMIAPSPDWIVQINNRNTFVDGMFLKYMAGDLIAYDGGTDDGREFTDPMDLSLDLPTEPKQNIAPLVEDETDRFEGRVVGRWMMLRVA